jgi:hypothetical protein
MKITQTLDKEPLQKQVKLLEDGIEEKRREIVVLQHTLEEQDEAMPTIPDMEKV